MALENRGAIAVLSSARLVFASTNFSFNYTYYQNLFNSSGSTARLGEALVATRAGRTASGTVKNDEKFHVYGDPTLRIAMPRYEVKIIDINI